MKKKILSFIILSAFYIISSCFDLNGNKSKPDILTQQDKDKFTGYAIIDAISQIYNINLAGKQVGNVNISTDCAMGGSVIITGTTGKSADTGITTVDLLFEMTDCKSNKHTTTDVDTSIVLTGNLTWKGSFDSSRNYKATNFRSESLSIEGSIDVPGFETAIVDETCEFSATETNGTVSGIICSRDFSY